MSQKSTIPNPARSPAQARANLAGKLPALIENCNAALDGGNRLIAVPAGAAASLAVAMREQGWTVQVGPGEAGAKNLLFSCADDRDVSEEG